MTAGAQEAAAVSETTRLETCARPQLGVLGSDIVGGRAAEIAFELQLKAGNAVY